MSHGRPPRIQRYAMNQNVMRTVVLRVTKLTVDELATAIAPAYSALAAMREGVATQAQWIDLASAVEISLAIEDRGIVRGIRGHIKLAEAALLSIYKRSMNDDGWHAAGLRFEEIDHVGGFVDLLHYQMEQLSAAEVNDAFKRACGRVFSDGGRMFKRHQVIGPGAVMLEAV